MQTPIRLGLDVIPIKGRLRNMEALILTWLLERLKNITSVFGVGDDLFKEFKTNILEIDPLNKNYT